MALFLFFLAKVILAYLPTAHFVALRSLFSEGSVCLSFSLKPKLFCMLFAVSVAPTSLPFFFSSSPIFALSLPLCPFLRLSFYLKLSGITGRNSLLSPPMLSDYNGSPDTRFSWLTTGLMSRPHGKCYLCPLQSLSSYPSYPLLSFLGLEAHCLT